MTTLVVETGSGISSANASVTLAEAQAYCAARGKDYSSYTDDQFNQAIVRASAFLASGAYKFMGYRTYNRNQTMAFPRYGVWDRDGWPINANEIPQEFKEACCELAFAELATPGTLAPSVAQSDKVKSETIGPISVEYLNYSTSAMASRPVFTLVDDLLRPFLDNSSDLLLRA